MSLIYTRHTLNFYNSIFFFNFNRVESNELVKIGDSSFSWDLYPDEYLLQNDRYQPVRWMAPESLKQPGFYSSKTDVVSLQGYSIHKFLLKEGSLAGFHISVTDM